MGVSMKIDDSLLTAWNVKDSFYYDGFFGLLVEGKQRIGKSSFCCQAGAEAFGEWTVDWDRNVASCVKPNYEALKPWIVFPPEEFLEIVLKVGIGEKRMLLIWDDAGFWLFILDWYEPFVKTVAKYIQLAGRQFSCIMLTTPSQKMISSKVLEALPELYVCKIVKREHDKPHYLPRKAKIYQRWNYPDGRKGGVRSRWKDDYNAILPDHFWKWYKPKSDEYMRAGMNLLEREVDRLKKKLTKKEEEEFMEETIKVAGSPERLREVEEVIKQIS